MDRYVGRRMTDNNGNPISGSSSNIAINSLKVENVAQILKKIFYLYADNWYWFALAITLAYVGANFYLKTCTPVYERKVSILIKTKGDENEKIIKELGLTPAPTSINNEMHLMKTRAIAEEVVRRLTLNVEYIKEGKFHDTVLYGIESPLKAYFLDLPATAYGSFEVSADGKGNVTLGNFMQDKEILDFNATTIWNDTIDTPYGRVVIVPTMRGDSTKFDKLKVIHRNANSMAGLVQAKISPRLRDNSQSILDIRYRDYSGPRAEDVLRTMMQVYNENWLRERNLKTVNTDKFIQERLAVIENELGEVEEDISSWKSENLMLDVKEAGAFAQTQVNKAENSLEELSNQEYMTRYIRNYLTDGTHNNQLLPANSGITNPSIESLISQYNDLMMQRNTHLTNSSLNNPLVKDLDDDLEILKGSILQSLDYELIMLQSKAKQIQDHRGLAMSKISSNPLKAKQLLSVERQQKVKEQLYLYLLERREENALSQAFDVYNNQFIEEPTGGAGPVEPVERVVYIGAIFIAVIIPTVILGSKEFFNTRVTGRNDLDGLSAPYGGDIPLYEPHSRSRLKFRKRTSDDIPKILVQEHKRNLINEAFRVIRSNLEFMLGFGKTHQSVMITSLTPSSGKTFITANLAMALAIRDKKVLAIDLDLRKGSLSKYVGSPEKGLSNYLSGQEENYENLIVPIGKMNILPCGTLPPNPAELLFSPRFKDMMEKVKKQYDYIFLDCPPVEIVADASVISIYADLTLFVVRVRNLYRDMLPDIEQWYHDKKYGNLAILLNGIEKSRGKYGYHRYGYHYGSYGYGYGSRRKNNQLE